MPIRLAQPDRLFWCPICHRRIDPPAWLAKANIQAAAGIKIKCGYCKRGEALIRPPAPPADAGVSP